MTSVERPLSGDVILFDLNDEREQASDPAILKRGKRSARTLVKSGGLRVTVVVIGEGGETADHQAEGPITIQEITGAIRFTAQGRDVDLRAGQLLYAAPGLRHRVSSSEGGTFLLTVAQALAPEGPEAAA